MRLAFLRQLTEARKNVRNCSGVSIRSQGLAKRAAARLASIKLANIGPNARFLAAFITIALVATAVCVHTFTVEASSAPAGAANSARIRWASASFRGLMSSSHVHGPLAAYLAPLPTAGRDDNAGQQGPLAVQVSGSKFIPGNYASVALAILDLNISGVGAGGVTFNVAAGYTETAPARARIRSIMAADTTG